MFDRRLVQNFDWGLLLIVLILIFIGLITLYSAAGSEEKILCLRQIVWYGIGFSIMIIMFIFDYKYLDHWAYPIFSICILMLISVHLFGKDAGGSKRWLRWGPLTIQPSEMIKISVVIVLARYYSKVIKPEGFTLLELTWPAIIMALPFGLIVTQPDLGTAMMVLLIAASLTMFVKIEKYSLLALISGGLIIAPGVWFFGLKPYQIERIKTFLDPDRDPLGAGYHIIQSKIAIGSGMIHGKGLMQGTQNALSFLPEQHTDFIFSVLAEEWGFIGAMTILILFLILLIWGLSIAYKCRDTFGTILATGVTILIFWQVFINLGMVMGLMPVVGMPLPLISYGGSSLMTIMVCIGILLNISMRRFN